MRKKVRKKTKRKKGRVIAYVSAAVLAIGLAMAFYGVYDLARKSGFTEGEAVGYLIGHDSGYHEGRENGYAEWYHPRYDNGYRDGYDNGFIVGYENGHADGFEVGYENGYEEGRIYMLAHGYPIMDPTYQDMREFLERDRTDEQKYVKDVYECRHFATDVCNNAERAGIRCAFVSICFPEGGHALVAFNTVDRGLIFIEPQDDSEVKVEVGKPYDPVGKTVKEILIAW